MQFVRFLFIITLYRFRLIFSGSFAPPTLQGMGIMAGCHAESASNEKKTGWLGYVGDYTTQLYRDYNKPL